MQFTVNVDCTPEEARRFVGLPDLSPVHAAYVDRMAKLAGDGLTPELVTDMMKSWGPMSEAGLSMWKAMIGQMGGSMGGAAPKA